MPFEMNHTIAPALNRVGEHTDAAELCFHAGLLIDDMWAEIQRLRKIEDAAEKLSASLSRGFVVCQRCGEQEPTADIDGAEDLRAILNTLDELAKIDTALGLDP